MAKPPFQDIVPPEKRSIRNVAVPERRKSRPDEFVISEEEKTDHTKISFRKGTDQPAKFGESPRETPRTARRFPWKVVIISLVALAIIAFVFLQMSKTSKVSLVLTPQSQIIVVSGQFNAVPESKVVATSSSPAGALEYQSITFLKNGSVTIATSSQVYTETKATGVIVVYNNYSGASQQLVANTRFKTPQGLIFRSTGPITIPGKKGSTPGSIEVQVVADTAGTSSNIGMSDFTIPGFDGTPRASTFYARSKTPMTGGFTGLAAQIDPSVSEKAFSEIKTKLADSLISQAQSSVPSGYLLPENGYNIEYTTLPTTTSETGGTVLTEQGVFHGLLINKDELIPLILKSYDMNSNGQTITSDGSGLVFSSKMATSSLYSGGAITFSLNGTTTAVSVIDTTSLKKDLAGKPRYNLNAILAAYPAIKDSVLTTDPFWLNAFPQNTDNIMIEIANSGTK